jgi:hypothetical protein
MRNAQKRTRMLNAEIIFGLQGHNGNYVYHLH